MEASDFFSQLLDVAFDRYIQMCTADIVKGSIKNLACESPINRPPNSFSEHPSGDSCAMPTEVLKARPRL